jgi:hypothetical protein
VKQFLEDGAFQTLYVTGGGEKVTVATNPPKQIKKKSVLFLKPNKVSISKPEQVDKELVSVDLSSGPLEQLSLIANVCAEISSFPLGIPWCSFSCARIHFHRRKSSCRFCPTQIAVNLGLKLFSMTSWTRLTRFCQICT